MAKPKTPADKLQSSYIIGFILSISFTFLAYSAVVNEIFGDNTLGFIMLLATAQFVVQLVYFLHMGKTSKPSWNDIMLYFMILVVVVLVLGSMWIMTNLDYHHGETNSPQTIDNSMIEDEGINRSSR